MILLVSEGLSLAFCIALIIAHLCGQGLLAVILKAAASLCFLTAGAYGFAKRRDSSSAKMLGAFAASAVGDVLLALDKEEGILFVIGVASFAAAHVMFLLVFCGISTIRISDVIATVVVVAGFMPLLIFGDFDYHGLFPIIVGYTVIVSFMMIKALSLGRVRKGKEKAVYLVMAGGVCFLLSDVLLLFCLFGSSTPIWVQPANWIIYYIAQICLSYAINQKELQ